MDISKLIRKTSGFSKRAFFLVLLLIADFLTKNFLPIVITNSIFYTYIGQPLFWLAIIVLAFRFPKVHPAGKLRLQSMLLWTCIFLSSTVIFIMMLAGVITGFGKSPYDHSLSGVVINLILAFTPLVGRELIRNYLINNPSVKKKLLLATIITLLMTICNLSVSRLTEIKTNLNTIEYTADVVLPEVSNNILASYLVFLGGPLLSIAFIGIQQAFYWLFPILPNLDWLVKGMICTLAPIFSLMFIQFLYKKQMNLVDQDETESENPIGWIVTSILSISIIWFAIGVFPIRPMVIATGSMEPVIYAGDMVMVKRISPKELKLGDIIQYKLGNIFIFHRIIEIVEEKDQIKYKTKGDNNSVADHELVDQENVKGKVIYTIPKIGWPVVFMKEDRSVDKSKVQF